MKKLILILLLLGGCSTVKPYADISIGYQLDGHTDYWVQTTRDWQCKNPRFGGEVGIESKNKWKLGLHHESWVLCGSGLNHDPEIYSNDIRLTKSFGGWDE